MKKILIDVGNTNIKIFIENYENNKFLFFTKKIIPNNEIKTFFELILEIFDDVDNFEIYVSSVVLEISEKFKMFFSKHKIKCYFLEFKDYSKLFGQGKIPIDSLGQDRFVDIIAAHQKYSKNIIFDLGTALTVDVISNYDYISGMIFPGIEAIQKGLIDNSSALKSIKFEKIEKNDKFLTTQTQINAGIILGIIGVINQYLIFLEKQIKIEDFNIILTGGTFELLKKLLGEQELLNLIRFEAEIIQNLNYQGLKIISQKIHIKN